MLHAPPSALVSRAPTLIFAAALAALPLILPNAYYYDVAIRIAANATVAIALNLLIGYTGQISLGHAAFFGLGAYGSAILVGAFGWPPLAALVASAAAVGTLAYLVGRAILRLLRPSGGSVLFDGEDITGLDRAAMRPLRPSGSIAASSSLVRLRNGRTASGASPTTR